MSQPIVVFLQCVPRWVKSKRSEEFVGRNSGEMYRCMGHRSMMCIYYANDSLTALRVQTHLKYSIKNNGQNTLVIQTNPNFDVMMPIEKSPAENSIACLSSNDSAFSRVCVPCPVAYDGT